MQVLGFVILLEGVSISCGSLFSVKFQKKSQCVLPVNSKSFSVDSYTNFRKITSRGLVVKSP